MSHEERRDPHLDYERLARVLGEEQWDLAFPTFIMGNTRSFREGERKDGYNLKASSLIPLNKLVCVRLPLRMPLHPGCISVPGPRQEEV